MSLVSIAGALGCGEGLALGKAPVGELEGAVGAPTGELPHAATANAAKSASACTCAFMLLERVPSDQGYKPEAKDHRIQLDLSLTCPIGCKSLNSLLNLAASRPCESGVIQRSDLRDPLIESFESRVSSLWLGPHIQHS